jgi:hypothetical protein
MRMGLKSIVAGTACAVALAGAGAARAAIVFDAFADFGATNPAGVWSYGYRPSGPDSFVLLTDHTTSYFGISGLEAWGTFLPVVLKNTSGSAATFLSVLAPTDRLLLHPAPGPEVVVRFTALSAADYAYNGVFSVLDRAPTGVTLFVGATATNFLGAGANLETRTPGSESAFSGMIHLEAGQSFDVAVGPDGAYNDDATGLTFRMTQLDPSSPGVPEPGAWGMALVGFALAGAALRSRRRAAAY